MPMGTYPFPFGSTLVNSVKRKSGLLADYSYHATGAERSTTLDNGTTYVLPIRNSEVVYNFRDIDKNGNTLTDDADYYWSPGRAFATVVAQPSAGDHYIIYDVQTRLGDPAVDDYLRKAERDVLSALRDYYPTDISTSPDVEMLIEALSVGRMRQLLHDGDAMRSATWRAGREMELLALETIKDIQNGGATLRDSTGAGITRTVGSLVGGFRHADGAITSFQDIRSRLAAFDQIALPAYPFDPDFTTESA